MEAFLFVVVCIIWLISGAASFIYWWTKDFDFTWEEFPTMVICGVCGPLYFFVGWWLHGEPVCDRVFKNKDGVLFKKRGKSS